MVGPSFKHQLARRTGFILQRPMAETTYFPRRIILAAALLSGMLLALAVHMLGARYGLDLGGLWRSDVHEFMPAGAPIAGGAVPAVAFAGGHFSPAPMAEPGAG